MIIGGFEDSTCANTEGADHPINFLNVFMQQILTTLNLKTQSDIQLLLFQDQVVAGTNQRMVFKLTDPGNRVKYLGVQAYITLPVDGEQISIDSFLYSFDLDVILKAFKISKDKLKVVKCKNTKREFWISYKRLMDNVCQTIKKTSFSVESKNKQR